MGLKIMPGNNRINCQRTWQPEKPLVPPGMEKAHIDQPLPKTTTLTSTRWTSRLATKNTAISITLFGFCIGFVYETWLTFFKVPGGETFYDFQRRKLGRDKYRQD